MGTNVYQIVTDRIIAELEKGSIPWNRPWTGVRSGAFSRSTGRPYSLLNQLLLGKPGEYMTFKQVQDAGGKVRKDEKGHVVVFWKMVPIDDKDTNGNPARKTIPMLRYYNVFHIDQCENVKPKYPLKALKPVDPIAEAEAVLADYSARARCPIDIDRRNEAFYRPATDKIYLPLREQFPKIEAFYSTAFHEVAHSTGHESRLNRHSKSSRFGNEVYSKEELVAEISAAILMNELGIETAGTFRNSAAYIQNWLMQLRNDNRLIVSAAGKAEKAVKLILNIDQAELALAA